VADATAASILVFWSLRQLRLLPTFLRLLHSLRSLHTATSSVKKVSRLKLEIFPQTLLLQISDRKDKFKFGLNFFKLGVFSPELCIFRQQFLRQESEKGAFLTVQNFGIKAAAHLSVSLP